MTGSNAAGPVAAYTQVDEGTWKDYALQAEVAAPFVGAMSERVPAYLEGMARGLPAFKVDRDKYSLHTATRALRAGECGEIVIAALVHDIGDVLAPENHSEPGVSILLSYVSKHTYWMVLQHGMFYCFAVNNTL